MYHPATGDELRLGQTSSWIRALGFVLLRYGLVLVIGWIAAMKATEYEAKGIQPLIAHSPLLSWGYRIWTVRQFTAIIGETELLIAALIALRRWSAKASAVGEHGGGAHVPHNPVDDIYHARWEPTFDPPSYSSR